MISIYCIPDNFYSGFVTRNGAVNIFYFWFATENGAVIVYDVSGGGNVPRPGTGTENMKLLFMVVLMAIVGCTLYINGFVQVFFPWVRQIGFQKYSLSIIARFLLNFAFFQFVPLVSATISQSQANSGGNNDGVLRNESELLAALRWLILVELIRK